LLGHLPEVMDAGRVAIHFGQTGRHCPDDFRRDRCGRIVVEIVTLHFSLFYLATRLFRPSPLSPGTPPSVSIRGPFIQFRRSSPRRDAAARRSWRVLQRWSYPKQCSFGAGASIAIASSARTWHVGPGGSEFATFMFWDLHCVVFQRRLIPSVK